MDSEFDEISLGSMDKLDKKSVIYVQMLRINKILSEAEVYSKTAIRTLESNLKADIEKLTVKNKGKTSNFYYESLEQLIKATNEKIRDIEKTFRDKARPTESENKRVEDIQFEFLAKKLELLIIVMSKRNLWGREAIEDVIDSYNMSEKDGIDVLREDDGKKVA